MNYSATNDSETNTAIVELGPDGDISVYTSTGPTNISIDVQGYVATTSADGGGYVPLQPSRIVDTRSGTGGVPATKLQPGGYLDITISGNANVPTGTTAVFANVIASGSTSDGYFRISTPGQASSSAAPIARYAAGQVDATGLVARLDSAGKVRVTNTSSSTVDLIVDIHGYFTSSSAQGGGGFTPSVARVFDTRQSTPLPAKTVTKVSVTGLQGIPSSNIGALAVNVTVVGPTVTSYLRVWGSGAPEPVPSAIDFTSGANESNLVFVQPGPDGQVNVRNPSNSDVNVVLDVQGWFGQSHTPATNSPRALQGSVDTSVVKIIASAEAGPDIDSEAINSETPSFEIPSDNILLSNGSYELRLNPHDLPLWTVSKNGTVTFDLQGFDQAGNSVASGTASARAILDESGHTAWIDGGASGDITGVTGDPSVPTSIDPTTDDGPLVASHVDVSSAPQAPSAADNDLNPSVDDSSVPDPSDSSGVSIDSSVIRAGTPAGGSEICRVYKKTVDYKDVWATVGTSYPSTPDTSRMTYSGVSGVEWTASFGVAIGGGTHGDYDQSGSKSIEKSFGFLWNSNKYRRSCQVSLQYKKVAYYKPCGGFDYYKWVPNRLQGTTSENPNISYKVFTHCVNQNSAGTWYRSQANGKAYSYSAGVKIASMLGINLSSKRNYNKEAKLEYDIKESFARKLCGNNDSPSTAGAVGDYNQ